MPEKTTKCNSLKLTTKHNGKMDGMQSLSTAASCNGRCAKNAAVPGSVCEKCYASTMCKMYSNLEKMLVNNFDILTSEVLPFENLPLLNVAFFRFESFGDLYNVTQCINYFNICRKNPHTSFAMWTKNPDIIENTINAGNEKPENLKVIVSSLFLNQVRNTEKYSFVDHVFTVYTLDYAKENGVAINCGSRKCINCLQCYAKKESTPFYISELLKQDQKKAKKEGFTI